MKKIIYLLSAMIVLSSLNLQAQNTAFTCGHDYVLQSMEQKYPGYNQAIRRTFEDAKERGANSSRTGEIYTIPVVVHVVWKAEAENLSDERINEQIAVLNEDYRRTNANADEVRAEFADVVGDTEIQFELTEIIRVQTETDFQLDIFGGGLLDAVKKTADGGSDAWDTENYLNIWVTNIPSFFGLAQIYGYAYPPADLAHWPAGASAASPEVDGVVIHYEIFGRNTTSGDLDFQGRTTVHEVGHYLGLRHIWGDGGGFSGQPGCDVDDGVDDTPNAEAQSEFDCDHSKNSCIDSTGLPDMVENFMDYSADACMNSFTYGQIDIMRGALEGPRNGLINGSVSANGLANVVRDLEAFPNPSTGLINLRFINSDKLDYTIQVRNILGQQVTPSIQESTFHANYNLDLSNQPTGIYFIELITNGQKMTKKVVLMD